ncbi:hypothetical protein P170DRAFT_478527 [Aspergillus steynii IBT 23096]|uniref:Uncharacterized protein n=1 Tax=Aspergillus steynii IBT 23096 TaxID=1392250 RepID=A0A2I2FY58_9EURO|nr:uncharacterized protein P170DRAFT_478527 [Aspergillus steynii IBT 23096]PLB45571.1 hypothetical protein P170DRAFT_478527 [Aspergillus steynii IBT 23096]
MESLQEILGALSAIKNIHKVDKNTLVNHKDEIESVFQILHSLLHSSVFSQKPSDQAALTSPVKKVPDTVTRILSYLNYESTLEFTKTTKKVPLPTISSIEDPRVIDIITANGKRTQGDFFRAGLGALSLADDFEDWADKEDLPSKLRSMVDGAKRQRPEYLEYVRSCKRFSNQDQARSCIRCGMKLKYLEWRVRECLDNQQLELETAIRKCTPLAFVWPTFFAWSLMDRCRLKDIPALAHELVMTDYWRLLARNTHQWITDRQKDYKTEVTRRDPSHTVEVAGYLSDHVEADEDIAISSIDHVNVAGSPEHLSEAGVSLTGINTSLSSSSFETGQIISEPDGTSRERSRKRCRTPEGMSQGENKRHKSVKSGNLDVTAYPTIENVTRPADSNDHASRYPVSLSAIDTSSSASFPSLPTGTSVLVDVDINDPDWIHDIPLSVLLGEPEASSSEPNIPSSVVAEIPEPVQLMETSVSVDVNIPEWMQFFDSQAAHLTPQGLSLPSPQLATAVSGSILDLQCTMENESQ